MSSSAFFNGALRRTNSYELARMFAAAAAEARRERERLATDEIAALMQRLDAYPYEDGSNHEHSGNHTPAECATKPAVCHCPVCAQLDALFVDVDVDDDHN